MLRVRGFGFVRFFARPDAEEARRALDGYRLDGRTISVDVSFFFLLLSLFLW